MDHQHFLNAIFQRHLSYLRSLCIDILFILIPHSPTHLMLYRYKQSFSYVGSVGFPLSLRGGAMIPDGRGSKMLPIQAILANLGTSNSYFVDRPGQGEAALFGLFQSEFHCQQSPEARAIPNPCEYQGKLTRTHSGGSRYQEIRSIRDIPSTTKYYEVSKIPTPGDKSQGSRMGMWFNSSPPL